MELNEAAISIIKSPYIRDYLINSNHKFSIEEQITLILNSNISIAKKKDMLYKYIESNNIKEDIKVEVSNIINEIDTVYKYLDNTDNKYVITYSTGDRLYCCKNLHVLKSKLQEHDLIEAAIYEIDSSDEICCITINSHNSVINYSLANCTEHYLYDKYVNIPNDIQIGDIIGTIYSEDKFIVINDTEKAQKFKNDLKYEDASVVVIPLGILDNSKDYKQQIEEIYINRINDIENPCAKPDILMENYITFKITDIIK